MRRRKTTIFFVVLGISLIALAVALQVGWILLNLQQIALLVLGIVFFALLITGLILNTTFLVREIRKNEQQNAFLNSVTHELKTPIASIRLYLETLKTRDVSDEKREEFYDVMLSDSDRLLATVEQVLAASKAKEKAIAAEISDVDLYDLLEESAQIVSSRYHLGDDAIRITGPKEPVEVAGDRAELGTVFTNLFDNAVKYSGSDPDINVKVRIRKGGSAEIHVRDRGAGIPGNELKSIFRRFYRVRNDSTPNARGTGLGLFIVKSIVESHGGRIFAKSRGESKGSTFIVRLPLAKKEEARAGGLR